MNAGIREGGWLLGAALLHAALVFAAPASAQDAASAGDDELRQKAKSHFERGVEGYDAGRYQQALSDFQEAHRLRPHPLVHVNIANCYDELGRPLQAIFHFERFLESDAGTPAQRTEVTAALERLRTQVGRLILRITPDGATVTIDRGEQRRAPILEPIQLEAGEHALKVRLEGYKPLERVVRLRGGMTYELNVALERAGDDHDGTAVLSITKIEEPEPAPASAVPATGDTSASAEPMVARDAAPVSDSGAGGRGLSSSVWIAGGTTAALGATTLVMGVLALSAEADFDDQRAQLALATTPAERVPLHSGARDAADRAQALALTTDILLVITAAGAALTTYLALTDDGGASAARVTPVLARDRAGMRLRAAF